MAPKKQAAKNDENKEEFMGNEDLQQKLRGKTELSPSSSNLLSPSTTPKSSGEKSLDADGSNGQNNAVLAELSNSPLSVFLGTFKEAKTQWVARQVIIMISILYRLGVGLGEYSGFGNPPMFGDFEAQRHWMEITLHLTRNNWYWYDLQYWGLDYPPLTAYHSWLFGYFGSKINSSWFELDTSRGCEDPDLKSYMRLTVVLSELAVYIPAVSMFVRWKVKSLRLSPLYHSIASAAILFQPALIIIDHGHFQYNCVMLGFTLLAITNILQDRLVVGSIFFVLSLSFKQMALYYSLPIFAYLLGLCIFPRLNLLRFISLGVSVVLTFSVVIFPMFLYRGVGGFSGIFTQLQQIFIRIFPLQRGLWEDKVSNVWCTMNTIVKLRLMFNSSELQRISAICTILAILPALVILFLHPRKNILIWGLSVSAWGFFLFSYQVHEKTVLLPLLPVTLQLADNPSANVQSHIYWINNVAMFSLWPLLKRDGLVMQYFVIIFLWNWLMESFSKLPDTLFGKLIILSSYSAIVLLHIFEMFVPAPGQYPDIYVLANITLCCGCFGLFLIWNYSQLLQAVKTKTA
ncbi:glycosyl transferase [Dipodascopsis uninucleata]